MPHHEALPGALVSAKIQTIESWHLMIVQAWQVMQCLHSRRTSYKGKGCCLNVCSSW